MKKEGEGAFLLEDKGKKEEKKKRKRWLLLGVSRVVERVGKCLVFEIGGQGEVETWKEGKTLIWVHPKMVCMVLHPPTGALMHLWVLGDSSPNNLSNWHLRQYKPCTNSCLVRKWNNTSLITIVSCLVGIYVIPTSYQGYNNLNNIYIPMWCGIKARVAILLLCVNQFYSVRIFAFGFVFHHSTIGLVVIQAMKDWNL